MNPVHLVNPVYTGFILLIYLQRNLSYVAFSFPLFSCLKTPMITAGNYRQENGGKENDAYKIPQNLNYAVLTCKIVFS